uniref:Regulatory protein E2 n=1 Tax=Human papillomavirus TaxID=10566 RepID=A0A385PQH3_9PAPI|nr:MAG: E2 protein [Human papillomavirus]
MNQADLTRRFDALEDRLMTLYESEPNTIDEQIQVWETIRKQNILYYYGRKEGYKNFGLQPIPPLAVSEYKAKEAIQQVLLLKSLKNSAYARENWSLVDTSAELTHTAPRNTFKKGPYIVEVHYDNNPQNAFPYTNWNMLYVQDEHDNWYKTEGKVDVNGLYFEDPSGDKNYFVIFASDAPTYGSTGLWTVHYKNETISNSAFASTSQESFSGFSQGSTKGHVTSSKDTVSPAETSGREESEEGRASSTTDGRSVRLRRRRPEQGESTPRRKRRRLQTHHSPVSPGQVGRRYNLVPRTGLTRLERLTEEARDPPIIVIKGGSNQLKCWRWRCKKSNVAFKDISTVFTWVNSSASDKYTHRMIVAFENNGQRNAFLANARFPKDTAYTVGNLNSL